MASAASPMTGNDSDAGYVLYEFSGVQATRCAGASQVWLGCKLYYVSRLRTAESHHPLIGRPSID